MNRKNGFNYWFCTIAMIAIAVIVWRNDAANAYLSEGIPVEATITDKDSYTISGGGKMKKRTDYGCVYTDENGKEKAAPIITNQFGDIPIGTTLNGYILPESRNVVWCPPDRTTTMISYALGIGCGLIGLYMLITPIINAFKKK